jgi:hypothetical protein
VAGARRLVARGVDLRRHRLLAIKLALGDGGGKTTNRRAR